MELPKLSLPRIGTEASLVSPFHFGKVGTSKAIGANTRFGGNNEFEEFHTRNHHQLTGSPWGALRICTNTGMEQGFLGCDGSEPARRVRFGADPIQASDRDPTGDS